MWWGESVDKEVKEKGVCRILHICFEYMGNWLNNTLVCICVATKTLFFTIIYF